MNSRDKLIKAKLNYLKAMKKYEDELWKNETEGQVSIIKKYTYARPMVTFNGTWKKERYISTEKPIETKFAEVDGEIYYPKMYYNGDNYKYELYTKDEYLSREVGKVIG